MKSFRATGIMASIVALLVAYTVFDSRREEKSAAEKAEKDKVLSFKANEIESVLVKKPDEQFELAKQDGAWKVIRPFLDEAEGEGVQAWLENMSSEKGSEIQVPQGDAVKWENYNLDQPGASVTLKGSNGSELSYSVSRLAAFDGSYFLRIKDKLVLGTSAWAGIVQKSASQLRNKMVWRRPGLVTKLKIKVNHPEIKDFIELTRSEDGSWKGLPFATSNESVDQYVETLKELRALDFEAGDFLTKDKSKYKLDRPMLVVDLTIQKEAGLPENWSMEVGAEDKGLIFARSSSVNSVFKLSSFDAKKLRKGQSDFRDHKAPFHLAIENVREIKVKSAGEEFLFKKTGTEWKLEAAPPEKRNAVDISLLEGLLTQMAQLEAKEFLAKGESLGAIQQSLEFQDESGRPILKLEAGEEFTPKEGSSQNIGLRKIRSSLSKEPIALNSSDWNDLPLERLIKGSLAEEKSNGQK